MIRIDLLYKRKESIQHYESELRNTTEKWIKEIYLFLIEWYNESEFIELSTSGSTGNPKRINVKKSAMIFSATQTNDFFNLKKEDKFLLCLPAEFVGGKMMLIRALLCGAEIYAVEPKIEVEIPDFKVDFAAMIPLQTENYLKQAQSTIRKVIIGGASISISLEHQIKLFKGTEFWSTYGMTETVSHIALRELNGSLENEYYKPLKNVLVGVDERGCLTIYNKNYNENVIVTNDLVEFDSDNNFKVIGRIDNVINSGGLKIVPEPLEEEIYGWINKRNLLVGLDDEKLGQKLVLLLEGEKLDDASLSLFRKALKDKLGNKSPKEIYFLKSFVETENGKVNRTATKNLL